MVCPTESILPNERTPKGDLGFLILQIAETLPKNDLPWTLTLLNLGRKSICDTYGFSKERFQREYSEALNYLKTQNLLNSRKVEYIN